MSELEEKPQLSRQKDCKPIAGEVARKIMEKYHFVTIRGDKSEDVMVYNNTGIYSFGGESLIRENTQALCGDMANTHFAGEVIGHIRRSTYISREVLDEGENVLNAKNGLVNMRECKLEEHTPLYYSLIQLPVSFDRNAKCPKIEAFLRSIFTAEDAEVVKEFLGFLLVKGYPFHKALMITGESHSGKTTVVNLITTLIGMQNTSSVTLQDLCDKPFSVAELHNKIANISDDLPSNTIKYAGQFKRLTGESTISAERKFKDPFTFTNSAKAIFTCNELPPVSSGDDAYFYRWLIVETNSKFDKASANRSMLREITAPEELSGLLNVALRYRAKLLKQNDFSSSADVESARNRYMLSVKDSVAKFLAENVVRNSDSWAAKGALYESYTDWCADFEMPVKASNAFHRRLQQLLGKFITNYQPTYEGRQIQAYKGIILKGSE